MYINSDYGTVPASDQLVSALMISELEPLLWKYRVNVAVYGHNHVYQRQAAVLNSTVVQLSETRLDSSGNTVAWHENPQATVHLIVGTAGASFTKTAVNPPPAWNELYFYEWGYAVVKAENASYLSWEWANASTGVVMDRMVIVQDPMQQEWVIS